MLLAVDIGNTNIVVGVFKGDLLKASWRLSTKMHITSDEYGILMTELLSIKEIKKEDIHDAIVSSVVPPLTPVIENTLKKYYGVKPLIVSSSINTGLNICYKNPDEVGADRIVNAVAVYTLYGGPAIIVDFGTATTFCVISQNAEYIGGVIMPGLTISAEALWNKASRLTRVSLEKPDMIIGDTTVKSMQSGILLGHVGAVDRIIEEIKFELSNRWGENLPHIIATGGFAELIVPLSRYIKIVKPSLTLEGLRIIYEKNRGADV
ncbi:MAG: type III pantothenate kinase [Nitrospirota bacterium]